MAGILRVDQANVDYIYAKTAGGKVYVPGHGIQIVQTVKTDTFTLASSTYTLVTGMSVSITPVSTSSKILILCDLKLCGQAAVTTTSARLMRNSTVIYAGDASSSRAQAMVQNYWNTDYTSPSTGGVYLDSPGTTSTTTYSIQIKSEGQTVYVNRTQSDRDALADARTASSITVMEIAQ